MASIEGYSLALLSTREARSEIDLAAHVEAYSLILFRVAHSMLRSRAEAEDVVQDVFVRMLKHRESLPAVRDMRVWLIRIAWNLALDRRRRIRPEQMDESFARSLAASSVPADEALDEAQRLRAVLGRDGEAAEGGAPRAAALGSRRDGDGGDGGGSGEERVGGAGAAVSRADAAAGAVAGATEGR